VVPPPPQFCSSELSPQSLSPSHCHQAEMQCPVAHSNWLLLQPAAPTHCSIQFNFISFYWERNQSINQYSFITAWQNAGQQLEASRDTLTVVIIVVIIIIIPGPAVVPPPPQFCSSELSPQSLSPSHCHQAEMQCPVAHSNWLLLQPAAPTHCPIQFYFIWFNWMQNYSSTSHQ